MRAASLLALLPMLAAPWAPAHGDARRRGGEEVVELRINGQEAGTTLLVRRDADGALLAARRGLRTAAAEAAAGSRRSSSTAWPTSGSMRRWAPTSASTTPRRAWTLTLPADAFVPTVAVRTGRCAAPSDDLAGRVPELQPVDPAVAGDRRERRAARARALRQARRRDELDARARRAGASAAPRAWTRPGPATCPSGSPRCGSATGSAHRAPGDARCASAACSSAPTSPRSRRSSRRRCSRRAARPSCRRRSTCSSTVGRSRARPCRPGRSRSRICPSITGTGELQVVVTDALGRQQVISQPYYSGSTLLRAGLNEYSFEVGAIREDYGLESFAYGDPFAAGTFRRGITDTFTAEVHAETQVDGASALGLDTAWQVGTLGVVTATAAAGRGPRRLRLARRPRRRAQRAAHASSSRARSSPPSDFVQVGLSAFEQRPKQRSFAGVGVDLARFGSLQFAYGRQSFWDSDSVETLGLSYSAVAAAATASSACSRITRAVAGLADRRVPGLDDADGRSPQRRLEPGVPSRPRRSVTPSRRRPRCSRTCRPARARATT